MKEEVAKSKIDRIVTISLAIMMFIIPVSFFYLLSVSVTPSLSPGNRSTEFGIDDIVFSIVVALLVTGFLLWVKSVMTKNKYLGVIIGVFGLGLGLYGLFNSFVGTYTTVFAAITSIIILAYLGFYFFRIKN